ncbi:MAG: T-complex protein 1 subunit delta [Marteilia pararefringens]
MYDAISAVACVLRESKLVAGGGAVETSIALHLKDLASRTATSDRFIYEAFADGLEIIPSILCENIGINKLLTVMQLEKIQREKGPQYGISGQANGVANMAEENVVQPSIVTKSAISLAVEFVCSILKVDDIIMSR